MNKLYCCAPNVMLLAAKSGPPSLRILYHPNILTLNIIIIKYYVKKKI